MMSSNSHSPISVWVIAARPRTLALALASVGMGTFLAAAYGPLSTPIALLTFLTAILLQILSNLANDYGDSIHGADRVGRTGPGRAVQTGQISISAMRRAIVVIALLTITSGVTLLWLALGGQGLLWLLIFTALGLAALWAAISYTAGSIPYGYAGLGDLAVLIFFGWVAVIGSFFVQTKLFEFSIILPATSCGLFAVGVLNVNNIRDMKSDRMAGKNSLPVRLGLRRARIYHWGLLIVGFLAAVLYVLGDALSGWEFLFVVTLPLFLQNGMAVTRRPPEQLDPYLRQMSLATLLFVVTFGIGQLLA